MSAVRNWRSWLDTAAAVSVIVASLSVVLLVISLRAASPSSRAAGTTRQPTVSVASLDLDGAVIKGQPSLGVGVVEYSDFECPFCRTFARDTLPQVITRYVDTGKVFIAFKSFPLAAIHKSALVAAEVAECGRRQGKFWEVHDALFGAEKLSTVDFQKLGLSVGLEPTRLTECLQNGAAEVVEKSVSKARSIGIHSTPTFLFVTRSRSGQFQVVHQESGAIPLERFANVLDDAIKGRQGS